MVDRIDVMLAVELAVEVRMEEAYSDLPVCHGRSKKHFGVLNGLVQTSVVLLEHSSAGCNMEDLKVFDYVLHMKELLAEDVRLVGRAPGSSLDEKGFAHMVMRYSARRAAAAVVLDP